MDRDFSEVHLATSSSWDRTYVLWLDNVCSASIWHFLDLQDFSVLTSWSVFTKVLSHAP